MTTMRMPTQKRPSRLRGWLAAHGVILVDFAAAIGIGPSHLSLIINGKRQPSLGVALKIQRLTGIAPAEIRPGRRRKSAAA